MTIMSLAQLAIEETKAAIYAKGLQVAQDLGLPVTSWEAGDPVRSLYHFVSEILSTCETVMAAYARSGFLDWATGEWLRLLAYEVYGYEARDATHATTTVTLTNTGGGLYVVSAGDLVLKNSTTGATYHSTSGGTLASGPGTTLDVTVQADVAGSDGSAAIGEIDDLVTVLLGVTCSNAAAAIGADAEPDVDVRANARAMLGALSPNGPRDAYRRVAVDSDLTGTDAITKARAISDSDTGKVYLYVAGPGGSAAAGDVALVQTAIERYAAPLCVTPVVASATPLSVDVTYTAWIYRSVGVSAAVAADSIETALEEFFSARPIGGDIASGSTGYVFRDAIEGVIRAEYPGYTLNVVTASPAADVAVAEDEVPTIGTVTATVNLVSDP